jgi:hypothetical protein
MGCNNYTNGIDIDCWSIVFDAKEIIDLVKGKFGLDLSNYEYEMTRPYNIKWVAFSYLGKGNTEKTKDGKVYNCFLSLCNSEIHFLVPEKQIKH